MLLISQRLNFGESKNFKFEPPRPEGARARGGISGKQHWRLGERYLDGQTPVGSGCGHIASPRPSDSAPKAKSLYPFQTPGSSKIFLGANGILLQVQFKSRSVGLLLKKKANSHLPESELRGAREADQLRKGKRLEIKEFGNAPELWLQSEGSGGNVSRLCLCGFWSSCNSANV